MSVLTLVILLTSCPNPFEEALATQVADGQGPAITITSPEPETYFSATTTVSGTILDRDAAGSVIEAAAGKITSASYRVRSSDVTGSIEVASDGGFSVDIDTTFFSRTITIDIAATDYAGNTTTEALQLFYDAQGPATFATRSSARAWRGRPKST